MFVFFLQHRRLLYDLFTKNYKVRRNIVQARLNQEFGDVCKADVDRLLNVRWTIRLNISVFPSFSLNISDLTAPSVLFSRSAVAATQGCGTSREQYSPDTERPAPCGHRLPIRSSPRCPVGGQWDRRQPITARPALRTKMSAICSAQNIKLFQQSIFWH